MPIRRIVKFGDPVLERPTERVGAIDGEVRALVKDMIETMYAENGVGLAANQVGVSKQIFIVSADQVHGKEMVFFNPRIIRTEGTLKEFEGCLSVPELYEPVKRAKTVWMKAITLEGKKVEVKASGLLSRIFQHETDHLNGFLFVDRLGFVKSALAKKKLLKRSSA